MELSEYVLEPFRKDEEFILYRRQHRNQVDAPSVLLLAPVSTHPALESLKSMEHEYSLRAELDLSSAVRPLALSQLNGQTRATMAFWGRDTPSIESGWSVVAGSRSLLALNCLYSQTFRTIRANVAVSQTLGQELSKLALRHFS